MPDEVTSRVLVVDDNTVNRMTLVRGVRELGHEVMEAASGEAALELLRTEPFDAVLLDVVMPGIDGIEVLERLKSDPELRAIPVIMVSAVEEAEAAVHCIELGAEDYLPKPVDPVLLRARLRAGLQRKHLRDLESALRDQEKLAALGRIAANVAHEVNNPVGAALRTLDRSGKVVARVMEASAEPGRPPSDPLARSDLEGETESLLRGWKVAEPWEKASVLVEAGYDPQTLLTAMDGEGPDAIPELIARLADLAELRQLLSQAHQALSRVPPIVAKLKAYSYMDRSPEQDVDLREDLAITVDMLAPKAGPKVRITVDHADHLPLVRAVGGELSQVWTNLIDNALDAVGSEGEVMLATRVDDGWVVVEIADDGPGIPEELQAKIFDPFFTTKERGEGSGLGLSIVRDIIRRHGGTVEVASSPGDTRITVRLPAT